MIIRAPALTEPGSVSTAAVTSTDFYPTMLELAGLPARPEQHLDGVSLRPLLSGGNIPSRPLYWHYPHYGNQGGEPSGAVREGDWKLIEWYEDGRIELFDLRQDLSEHYNLVRLYPGKAEQLHGRLKAWRADLGAAMPAPNPRYKSE
jgi:arylsulfatase A-like enzyme